MKKKKANFKRLDELHEEGYLRKVTSPCGKLFLYNYTDKCTYDKKWNKHTLNARGTVYEVETGKLVAQAFPKFFNFGELQPTVQRSLVNKTNFSVNEKMDGSLGIVYHYEGKWYVNTRGSFTSDQAIKATQLLNSKYNMECFPIDVTLMVEIIYPENRIIVDYGSEEKLTVIGAFDLEHGAADLMAYPKRMEMYLKGSGLEMAPTYHDFRSISEVIEVQSKLGKMEEGFVVRFQDGYRCKFKSAEYLKVARLLSEMTPLNFWKAMKDGVVQEEIISEIPEEFRDEVDRIKGDLETVYKKVTKEVAEDFNYAIKSFGGLTCLSEDFNRRQLGLFLKENGSELRHQSAMFPMLLNKGVDKYVMKTIRPKGNQNVVL